MATVEVKTILSVSSHHVTTSSQHQPGPPHVILLDMPFHVVTFREAVDALIRLAQGNHPTYAVTANVDHVVRFHRNPKVRPLYAGADLVVADGTPLVWASRLLGQPLPERVAGSDLFPVLCARAAENDLTVFLLGGAPTTAERAAKVMRAKNPGLNIVGTYCPAQGFEHDA